MKEKLSGIKNLTRRMRAIVQDTLRNPSSDEPVLLDTKPSYDIDSPPEVSQYTLAQLISSLAFDDPRKLELIDAFLKEEEAKNSLKE